MGYAKNTIDNLFALFFTSELCLVAIEEEFILKRKEGGIQNARNKS